MEELYRILWAYRTTWIPTGEIPFNLAVGMMLVILVEIGLPLTRVEDYDELRNSNQ